MDSDDEHLLPPDEPDRPEDLNEPRDVSRRRVASRQRELDRQAFLRSIMGSKVGRAWMYDLLAFCRVGVNPFRIEPIAMAFNCGQLNVGQRLIDDLSIACPELYHEMMQENTSA